MAEKTETSRVTREIAPVISGLIGQLRLQFANKEQIAYGRISTQREFTAIFNEGTENLPNGDIRHIATFLKRASVSAVDRYESTNVYMGVTETKGGTFKNSRIRYAHDSGIRETTKREFFENSSEACENLQKIISSLVS